MVIRFHRKLHTMTHSSEVGWRCPHRRSDLLTTARAALFLCLAVLVGYSAPVYAGQTFDEKLAHHRLWPDGEVPFRLSKSFTLIEQFTIRKALLTWEVWTHSAVRFIVVTGGTVPKEHLHILTPDEFNGLTRPPRGKGAKGCGAWGPQTSGVTYLWLAQPDCINEPSVIHEVGHTIGLGHEHLRLDRDLYMTIGPPSPVCPEIGPPSPDCPEESPVGFFDYRSIMHSHPVLAISQPKSSSILPWDPPVGLSEGDVDTIRALYAFEVRRHSDILGGDYTNFPLLRDTQRACQLACAADVRCMAYTYAGKGALPGNNPDPHCFLKGDGKRIPAFESGLRRDIHSGKRKPGQLGSFGAARDVDLFGGQISGGVVTMPNNVLNGANCKDLCVSDSKCDAFTFAPAEMSGTCFKKSHKPDVPGEPPFSYQRREGFLSGVVRPP